MSAVSSPDVNLLSAANITTGPVISPLSGSITATGAASGYIFNVSAYTCVTIKVTAPAAGCSISFASSILGSGTPPDALFVTKVGSGVLVSSDTLGANATQIYQCNVIGQIQADVYATTLSSGTITIVGNITTDSVALNQYVQAVQSGAWALSASATGGYTPGKLISAASTNATVIKAAPGTLGYLSISNVNAAARFVKFYNQTAAPSGSGLTSVMTIAVPSNGATGAATNIPLPPQGMAFSIGIAFWTTANVADNDTTAVALNDLVINYGWI